jgi:hypothetical protein
MVVERIKVVTRIRVVTRIGVAKRIGVVTRIGVTLHTTIISGGGELATPIHTIIAAIIIRVTLGTIPPIGVSGRVVSLLLGIPLFLTLFLMGHTLYICLKTLMGHIRFNIPQRNSR